MSLIKDSYLRKKILTLDIKTLTTYLLPSIFLTITMKAQQSLFSSHHLLSFSYNNPLPVHLSMIVSHDPISKKQILAFSYVSINDLPFFCAMECKVRKRTNIWIKLRAGDDASYMRMINSLSK